jgi:hypothetical protein
MADHDDDDYVGNPPDDLYAKSITQVEYDAFREELKVSQPPDRLKAIVEFLLERVPVYGHAAYDKAFGDERVCACGHTYYRHFDSYEQMAPVGCKYCDCDHFVEPAAKAKKDFNLCPYEHHAADCDCRGVGGDR